VPCVPSTHEEWLCFLGNYPMSSCYKAYKVGGLYFCILPIKVIRMKRMMVRFHDPLQEKTNTFQGVFGLTAN